MLGIWWNWKTEAKKRHIAGWLSKYRWSGIACFSYPVSEKKTPDCVHKKHPSCRQSS
jgi:hypothetical protein